MDRDGFEGAYRALLEAQEKLYPYVVASTGKHSDDASEEGNNDLKPIVLEATAVLVERSVKITVFEPLPKTIRWTDCKNMSDIKRVKELDINIENRWIAAMKEAYKKTGLMLRFIDAVAIVLCYIPVEAPWDVDNRAIRYALNGLKCLGLIPDDSAKHLSLYIEGRVDKENPRTEIIVGHRHLAKNFLDAVGI